MTCDNCEEKVKKVEKSSEHHENLWRKMCLCYTCTSAENYLFIDVTGLYCERTYKE